MPKPLVFISHSAKDDLARSVLDKLSAAMDPDFEVLLDQFRLQPGDRWRQELDIWMSLCQAAVIIFSENALESDWVLQEATILRWRRAWDQDFILVPVLMPTVRAKALKENKKFAPLHLDEIQMASANTADDVVKKVIERLAPLKNLGQTKTPLHELEDLIASRLYELESKRPESLRNAADILETKLPWRSNNKYSQQLARALLSAEFAKVSKAVLLMAPHMSRGAALDIIDRLAPFWVDVRAVVRVPEMIKEPQKQRAICVNSSLLQFTPKMYLRRAQLSVYPWVSARVNLPKGYEEQPQSQIQLIEKEIGKQVLPQLGFDEEDEQDLFSPAVDRLLQTREKKEPLFIIVPEDLDDEVLDALRQKFVRFTFFVLKKDEAVDPAKLKLKCIELLEPKIDPKKEDAAYSLYFDTRGDIKRLPIT
ncbi:MAG TPA: toll/interleukin-1 receptor domain-containing protein [Pyrinomonadaceae bacterium]|jgi:hypothetical protein|nr:toll/interleukin-1 receptor domain-containing protein [Pyrinomonadaceae bacterium]